MVVNRPSWRFYILQKIQKSINIQIRPIRCSTVVRGKLIFEKLQEHRQIRNTSVFLRTIRRLESTLM